MISMMVIVVNQKCDRCGDAYGMLGYVETSYKRLHSYFFYAYDKK